MGPSSLHRVYSKYHGVAKVGPSSVRRVYSKYHSVALMGPSSVRWVSSISFASAFARPAASRHYEVDSGDANPISSVSDGFGILLSMLDLLT